MNAIEEMWRTDRPRLIALAGAAVAVVAILLDLDFMFRPGTSEVLGGLLHHAFVLGLMLVLTARSRTVSLGMLGMFWLIGVWAVFLMSYGIENQVASVFGADVDGTFVPTWLSPFVEETRLVPVAIFLLLAGRSGFRHPSMSDGMLLGFMVGAGVSFHEDAHYGEILVSGDGWGASTPWTTILPTISPVDDYFSLNHALWGALGGLSVGAAVMLRHWRWTWPIVLVGPLFSVTNHIMVNHFAGTHFGLGALLNRGRQDAEPWFFDMIRDVTDSGRLPMLVLIVAAVAVVVAEWLILRWVAKRDRMFPALSLAHFSGLAMHGMSRAGASQLVAAERYARIRHGVYFAGWRTTRVGGSPGVTDVDVAELSALLTRSDEAGRTVVVPPGTPTLARRAAGAPPATEAGEAARAVPAAAESVVSADVSADGA